MEDLYLKGMLVAGLIWIIIMVSLGIVGLIRFLYYWIDDKSPPDINSKLLNFWFKGEGFDSFPFMIMFLFGCFAWPFFIVASVIFGVAHLLRYLKRIKKSLNKLSNTINKKQEQ